MAMETVVGLNVMLLPIAAIVAIVAVVLAWKVFKFTIKKIAAVIQGIIALILIALALLGQPQGLAMWFGLVGAGMLFGAISNVFS